MFLNILLPFCFPISFFLLKQKKIFLIFKKDTPYYIVIPSYIKLHKKKNFLSFSTLKFFKKLKIFFLFFSKWLKYIEKPFIKKIFFKGLGLKCFFIQNGEALELKLGFSHTIIIQIPFKKLKIKLFKNIISVEGCNLMEVSTFLDKIKKFKQPNIYKGKGLWYKNEIIKLKAIKKT